MFFWLRFAIEAHPRYTPATDSEPSNVNALTLELFRKSFSLPLSPLPLTYLESYLTLIRQCCLTTSEAFLDEKLILYPGSGFSIEAPGEEGKWELPFHRCTFAGNIEGTKKGLEVLGKVVKKFFDGAK